MVQARYVHLLFEKTVMIPEMNKGLAEAKILAIKEEGLRQCASIRVQARHGCGGRAVL